MRATILFFAYMFACLLLAAVLTVPLINSAWLDEEPQRIFARLAQLLMLLGLWPLLRWLDLDRRAALGFDRPAKSLRHQVLLGWLGGVLMMTAIVALLMQLGVRVPETWEPGFVTDLIKTGLRALIAGLLIALLEESFFRGALFSCIRRQGSLLQAAGWSALLYALVHFMKPHEPPDGTAVLWMLGSVFTGLFELQNLDSLLALWLAGVLLALLRERTGSIALGIGLHAGWVFVIQISRRLTDGVDQTGWAWLAGHYDGVIGWLAAVVLLLIIIGMMATQPREW